MTKTKIVIPFLLIAAAVLFAGNNGVYGSAGVPNPWRTVSTAPKGTEWTGTLVITGRIVDVTGLPAGLLPAGAEPAPGYQDQIVKIEFFVRLENAKRASFTFSGVAIDDNEYYLFYAVGDYTGRITDALHNFLENKVYPKLSSNGTGALTEVTGSSNNVETQLVYGLQAGTPLYYSAKIKVVTY